MKKMIKLGLIIAAASALTLTTASAKCAAGNSDTVKTMKCQAGKCNGNKKTMKCQAGKCNGGKDMKKKVEKKEAKGKCGQGKCGGGK